MHIFPAPRTLVAGTGRLALPETARIVIQGPDVAALFPLATRVQQSLVRRAGRSWLPAAGAADDSDLIIAVVPGTQPHPEGYQLRIDDRRITLSAATITGAFYAVQTLRQLLDQYGAVLPHVQITDWPDFANRGVMLDISRDKVPSMATLRMLIEQFAAWKINQVQLYTEHTFAYRRHEVVWRDASPLTGADILALDALCRENHIELVPNQNTFGHMQRWLIHDAYRPMAETPNGCDTGSDVWGVFKDPFSLAPTDPRSLGLVRELLDELLPHFSSRQVNVGCDETIELGLGQSAGLVAERGKGRVYLDFLLAIYREVEARGHTMQFWGDIIMEYPELVPELPRDAVALEWGYEFDHPFAEHGERFAAAGVPFYVCPGTSTWNSVGGRTDNTLGNLRNAAENGLRHGACGYLITDWGDNGHWQPLPTSYLGWIYGAGLAWCGATNRDIDIPQTLNRHVFRDRAGILGSLAYELGNAGQGLGQRLHNTSMLFHILQSTPERIAALPDLSTAALRQRETELARLEARLEHTVLDRPDADLIRSEFAWACQMLQHACRRGAWVLEGRPESGKAALRQHSDELQTEYRRIWLIRNQPGGLRESVERMTTMHTLYED